MTRTRLATGLTATAAALVLAACGGSDDSSSSSGTSGEGGGTTKISVGVIPTADMAPLYLGIQKGFFKEEKLDVTPQQAESGAAIVPSVVAGSNQIGYSNFVSLLTAKDKGLPVQALAPAASDGDDPEKDVSQVVVKKGSAIKDAKDLAGKTIALNSLKNLGEVVVRESVAKAGGDPDSLKFTELPYADMNAALEQGRVDAIWQLEPFLTSAKADGAVRILSTFVDAVPNSTLGAYFTITKYAGEHKDVVERFDRAIGKSLEYAAAHTDEVRDVVESTLKVPASTAKTMNLPVWTAKMDQSTVQPLADLAKKYGVISKDPDLNALLGGQTR
ncbi:ABC transporter substrate-binding protein [Patulibacter sp. SYSU D01012]|uniref:ABC transporter substrate-binding protein n=1 Tax=Patulibacter sp. SYSU D01012 TaxID=2817381 RepID=UPI001B30D3E4|nr:ABC transporter substrate-binding protein [Patulibacter sp. SYSU D01012]